MHGILREDVSVKYARIKEWRNDFPIAALCRVLGVSESGCYAWLGRPPSIRNLENARLELGIQAAHQRTRGTYGYSATWPTMLYLQGLTGLDASAGS